MYVYTWIYNRNEAFDLTQDYTFALNSRYFVTFVITIINFKNVAWRSHVLSKQQRIWA